MKSSIKKMSALLTMMATAILAFTFTACSDDEDIENEVTYTYVFTEISASHPDFIEEMNKIEKGFQAALGITGKPFTKKGSVEECDKQVCEACQKAFDSLKGEAWQGDYIFQVTNVGTEEVMCTAIFSADNENLTISGDKDYDKYYRREYRADEVKPGDYIYSDGSISDGGLRVRYDDNRIEWAKTKPAPTAGKVVSGIVFWTSDEITDKYRRTPANLADDKVMASDYPDCTHGLAVSLNEVSSGMKWQDPENPDGFVNDFVHDNNFTHEKKDYFESIASGQGATDYCNYILGYQNTQVLFAYNEYCRSKGKEADIVRPVAALDDFEKNHPSPAGSTGWFIPSPKELHILCYKDVDNIWNQSGYKKRSNKDIVNNSISAAKGDILDGEYSGDYWTSTEYTGQKCSVIAINFKYSYMCHFHTLASCHVRAVCAF